MTSKDCAIMTFTCSVLGWVFTQLGVPWIAVIIYVIGFVFSIWWIILHYKDKDKNNWRGGTPSAA